MLSTLLFLFHLLPFLKLFLVFSFYYIFCCKSLFLMSDSLLCLIFCELLLSLNTCLIKRNFNFRQLRNHCEIRQLQIPVGQFTQIFDPLLIANWYFQIISLFKQLCYTPFYASSGMLSNSFFSSRSMKPCKCFFQNFKIARLTTPLFVSFLLSSESINLCLWPSLKTDLKKHFIPGTQLVQYFTALFVCYY